MNHEVIKRFLFLSSPSVHPPSHVSPLADLTHPQDVGKEGFPVSDDHRLFQLPVIQEVFGQNMQGSQVGGLRGQDLKHTLEESVVGCNFREDSRF